MFRLSARLFANTRANRIDYAFFAAIWVAFSWLVGFPAGVFAQTQSGFTYNGVVYTSYQAGEYLQTPAGPQGAAAIRATGANYTSVLATQYQQTYTSTTIAPETPTTPGYVSSMDPLSPTDAAISAGIKNLQAQGLTVFLKPQVDSLDGTFRALFAPTDAAAWFASYQTFILHYAQLAAQNNVGGLVIGTELKSLTGAAYRTYWLNIISQIRSSYPSLTLIYGANATGAGDEFTTVSFWDKVDVIGVDGYFPLTNQADPTVAQLVAAWTSNKYGFNALAALKQLQSQYNKPLIFTELGYVSATGTNTAPYSLAANGAAYDPSEQQNCYEAFFQVFSQQTSWMKGVFWWAWSVSAPATGDREYTPQNKPAGSSTLPTWFGSTTPGFTLTPSNSILSVNPGQSAANTIAVTNLGGFTSPVTLAASGLPAGVSASFASGTGLGTQVLTLTAGTAAAIGPANILVTGTSGTLTSTVPVSLTVQGLASQTITFNNPGAQTVGTPLALAASASSGLALSFTSSTPAVCTISGATATFLTAGTCTIAANQSGNGSYAAAAPVQQSFTVSLAASFTLVATSPVQSVAQGGTAANTITVIGANGFSGSVLFTATNLPAGVTASFASNPATSASVITFAATSSAVLGPATVTITGVNGSLSSTVTVALTVTLSPGFTLAAAAPSLSVMQGSSVNDTLTVAGTNGFSGSPLLTATGLPAGVTAVFATNPVSGSSVLTLSAGTTATPGTSVVTITGTSGTITSSTTINLTITGLTSFSLAPASPMVSIAQGGTATDTITITGTGGFNGGVTLTAAGVPSGVTASFNANPATGSSVLSLTATNTATVGASTITISGLSGTLSSSTSVAITVSALPAISVAPASSTVTIAAGSSATDMIAISGSNGFSGTVALTAAITSSPAGASNLPALGFGSTSSLNVTSVTGGAATLTINTVAPTTGTLVAPTRHTPAWRFVEFAGLGGLVFFGAAKRRRKWYVRLTLLCFLGTLSTVLVGCGGSGGSKPSSSGTPGTTKGNYAVTVTATSGTTTATGTLNLVVQ